MRCKKAASGQPPGMTGCRFAPTRTFVDPSAQAEKGQDDQHDNDQADDVNDAVHKNFPSREWDE